ncbi:Hypothetical protein RM25_0260 [Propionibacterium freudenreichii subsp. freudenreichii]|nr:Hypothetical protein RM25_0260 [Propionibacterium freudenreichii subsp. freudenreichii]
MNSRSHRLRWVVIGMSDLGAGTILNAVFRLPTGVLLG